MAVFRSPTNSFQILTRCRAIIRRRRLGPLLVWVGVLMVVVALYVRQEAGGNLTGYAREIRYGVASETAGRLQRLEVTLNQDVSRGQIVASFEEKKLLLQLEEARTELNRIANELGRERALWELNAAGQQVDQQTNLRRFAQDASNAHIDYLTALAALAEDRITKQGLELTLNRTRQLEEHEFTSASDLDDDRIAFEALEAKVAKQESTTVAMFEACENADARYRKFLRNYVADTPDSQLLLKPLENAIEVQEIRIEMVNLAIVECVLRSPTNGRVAEIYHHAGEVVAAGQPVLSIVEPRASELVAYLPEHRIFDLQPGTEVRVRRVADPNRTFASSVASLGSSVDQMPLRLDPTAMAPRWGLAVIIPLPPSMEAIPGESFEISF